MLNYSADFASVGVRCIAIHRTPLDASADRPAEPFDRPLEIREKRSHIYLHGVIRRHSTLFSN
ncbi:hypothetical protein PWR63_30315 [Paraburkholderia sp. A2WS-5]|uniref:hypothetical protein n=1 Tax=unclassified Paraburkholderia TaxID=2615204 RepID=UPI003B81FFEA